MKVKVTFFKPTGKYYTDEEIEWLATTQFPVDNFRESLKQHLIVEHGRIRMHEMTAVCVDEQIPFPVMCHNIGDFLNKRI